jgi:hypothetical protein
MTIRLWLAAAFLALTGCSFEQTMDAMIDRQRQEQIVAAARTLCTNPMALEAQFAPEIWTQSQPLFPQIAAQCPPGGGDNWKLTTFRFNSASNADGSSSRQENTVIVAGAENGPWTEVILNYNRVNDGPLQIVGWNVQRLTERPPSLIFRDNWESLRIVGVIGGLIVLGLIIALVTWLVRRRRQGKSLTDA